MTTKPFGLQSPEQIAKDYGGNKQKIAEAMQMGIVDPTAGTLAAMFIDRMRNAAQQEQVPQQTVAQQVFAPPAPQMPQGVTPPGAGAAPPIPAGLGATPEAAAMAGPQATAMAAPQAPMGGGAPVVGMAGGGPVGPSEESPVFDRPYSKYRIPREESRSGPDIGEIISQLVGGGLRGRIGRADLHAQYNPLQNRSDYGVDYPIGKHTGLFANATSDPRERRYVAGIRHEFADGGMVAPYAAGGLSDLPVPDGMFDEPSNGGYARGGIVAFPDGGSVVDATDPATNFGQDIEVTAQEDNAPEQYYGFYKDPELMREQIDKLYKPERKYSNKLNEMFDEVISPEGMKKRRKQDMWEAIGQIGAKMATTPGSLLQATSAGLGAALPGIAASAKERRAEQRDAIKTLAANEGLNNKEALDLAKLTMEGTDKYGQFDMKRLDREQQERLVYYQEKMANERNDKSVGASMYGSRLGYSSSIYGSNNALKADIIRSNTAITNAFWEAVGRGGPNAQEYQEALRRGPEAAEKYQKDWKARQGYIPINNPLGL